MSTEKALNEIIGGLVEASNDYEALLCERREVSTRMAAADEARKALAGQFQRNNDLRPGTYLYEDSVVVVDGDFEITVSPAQRVG